MPSHYDHLESAILQFFNKKGLDIILEPHGSRGADIEGINGSIVVGEIKHKGEIVRDLKGYWSQWNSGGNFGGKTKEYKLRSEFPADVEYLSSAERGWIAVIYGQIRYYARTAGLSKCWLVVEDYSEFASEIKAAAAYLKKNEKCRLTSSNIQNKLGFLLFSF